MSELNQLAEQVYRHSGLKLDYSRSDDITHTLNQMCIWANVQSTTELYALLETLPTAHILWQMLLRKVTIGETYFFRNMAQYNALQNHLLPELIQKRRNSGFKHLNVWSAGCATGEEPYSVAMLLREILPDIADWTVTILATDINTASLETAQQGIYRANSFRSETRPDVQERYFTKLNAHDYELRPEIRRMVTYKPLNLITDEYPSFNTRTMHQDIIICRNVTIYFDEPTTRQIVNQFYQSLIEGGWLIVGHAEPVASTYKAYTTRNFENTVLYQKITPPIVFSPITPEVKEQSPLAKPVAQSSKPINKVESSPKPQILVESSAKPKPVPANVSFEEVRDAVNREAWAAALDGLVSLERTQPMNPQVHYLRGLVLMHSGEFDKARDALRRSLYCDPSFALAHYTMGELHHQQNNLSAARRCWMLAERAVAGLAAHEILASGDDLTVEMFRDLLVARLNDLEQEVK